MTREEAIQVLANFYVSTKNPKANHLCEAVYFAIQALKNVPKHGRWIYDDEAYPGGNPYGHYNCDQCGESVPHKTIYCPNCGARMFDKDTDVPDKNVGKMDEVENG